ncbi:MAG: hypothetical protein ACM3TT_08965 [Syntrophothermus sp.]
MTTFLLRVNESRSSTFYFEATGWLRIGADSDIDIAVVADGFTGDIIEDTFTLMKLRRQVDIRIKPHPFLPSEFREENPVAREVMRTGIRIV